MGCENYGLVMQPRFSHTILPYTIVLLCGIGFIAILRNRGIINTLDSHILFCLLACIYLLALVYTLWYKNKSYHIYSLHISCLPALLDYCAISTIDMKAIKKQYFDNFFDGSIILYAHNFYKFSGKTKMQIGIDTSRFYQNIVLYMHTNDDAFIEFIESKKFYPAPLWEFYHYQTGQRYTTPQEFIDTPPVRCNNWLRHHFEPFLESLTQTQKEHYCKTHNASPTWQETLCDKHKWHTFIRALESHC